MKNIARAAVLLLVATGLVAASGIAADARVSATKTTLVLTRTSTAAPVTGTAATFTGKVPVNLKGKKVALQRKVGTQPWVTLKSMTVPSTGKIATKGTVIGVGANKWRLRLVTRSTTYLSPAVTTTAYKWYYLSDLEYVDSHRFTSDGVTIGGTYYGHSVVNSTSFWYDKFDWREWNLGYKCTRLTASIGLDDSSTTGSQVNFVTTLDGADTDWGTKGIGKATAISTDISEHMRIRLASNYVAGPLGSGDTSGYGAWGNARILCKAAPANPA